MIDAHWFVIEWRTRDESIEQVECAFGLIHRHEVSRVLHAHERQSAVRLARTGLFATDQPGRVGSRAIPGLTVPRETIDPGRVAVLRGE
jgi:hypothetical protein